MSNIGSINIPAYAPVDIGGTAAAAVAQAPEKIAASDAAIAASKSAIAKDQDAQLARLSPSLIANPDLINQAGVQRFISPLLSSRGLSLDAFKDPTTGQYDPHKLLSAINPPTADSPPAQKPWAMWTQKEVAEARAQPPEQRLLPPDAPEWFRTAKAIVPLTDKSIDFMQQQLGNKEKLLGTGGYTPQLFLADVLGQRKMLQNSGQDTSWLDGYLNADQTGLSESLIDKVVGEKTQAEIDHLGALNVNIKDLDAYRTAVEAEKKREFDATQKFKYANLSREELRDRNAAAVASSKLQYMAGNLAARWASVQNSANTIGLGTTVKQINGWHVLLDSAAKSMSDASTELGKDRTLIEQMANNPQSLARPEVKAQYDALVQRAGELQGFLNTNGPQLDALKAQATQGVANAVGVITGHGTATPVDKPPFQVPAGYTAAKGPNGQWGVKDASGAFYPYTGK
jgi:hypothetical protein